MKEPDNLNEWNSDVHTREERYWESAFEESRARLDRQNDAIATNRDTLIHFLRYHFVIIGIVIAAAKIPPSGLISVDQWDIFFASLPSLVGILITIHGHRSLGSYNIGVDKKLFDTIRKESETYSEAMQRLSNHYHELSDLNRKKLHNHDKYRFWNLILYSMAFGAVLGVIVF